MIVRSPAPVPPGDGPFSCLRQSCPQSGVRQREVITVDFDGKVVEYAPDMLGELEPAFAVTVHKAQGSEYRAVILAALDGASFLMTRGVLYTAST